MNGITTTSLAPNQTFGLKLVDLLLGVTQLGEISGEVALVRGALLVTSNRLVQTGRTAHKDLYVARLGTGENLLEQVLCDETLGTTGPVLRWVVEDVKGAEAVGVLVLKVLELTLEENVLFADVAEDESDLGLVFWVLENGTDKLVHGGDSGSSGDQANVIVLVGRPGVLGDRALKVEALTGVHVVELVRHGSVGVALDNEVNVSLDVCRQRQLASVKVRVKSFVGYKHTFVTGGSIRADDGLLHLGSLVLCDKSGCKGMLAGDGRSRDGEIIVQATLRPEVWLLSGRANRNLFVLWLISSISSSFKLMKPWSPPVKAFSEVESPVFAGMFLRSSLEAGWPWAALSLTLPCWPVGETLAGEAELL